MYHIIMVNDKPQIKENPEMEVPSLDTLEVGRSQICPLSGLCPHMCTVVELSNGDTYALVDDTARYYMNLILDREHRPRVETPEDVEQLIIDEIQRMSLSTAELSLN